MKQLTEKEKRMNDYLKLCFQERCPLCTDMLVPEPMETERGFYSVKKGFEIRCLKGHRLYIERIGKNRYRLIPTYSFQKLKEKMEKSKIIG